MAADMLALFFVGQHVEIAQPLGETDQHGGAAVAILPDHVEAGVEQAVEMRIRHDQTKMPVLIAPLLLRRRALHDARERQRQPVDRHQRGIGIVDAGR